MSELIDITGIDLVEFAKKVYELSVPQGLGFLHYTPKPLSDEEAKSCLRKDTNFCLDMDYVNGRACKMTVFKEGEKLYIRDAWYDHSDSTFQKLLNSFNINATIGSAHGCACNCIDCQKKNAEMLI